MNKPSPLRADYPEDIDLLLLLERSLLFLRRYKWVFTAAIVAGLATGIFFYRSIPTTYRSRLVLHSYMLTNQEQLQVVANWQQLLKKKEHIALAQLFRCPVSILNKLKEIKGKEIQQVFTPSNPNGFTIDVAVTDNAILGALQQGMVYAFNNSEFSKERLAVKRSNLEEMAGKTALEIRRLDSTKHIIENIIGGGKSSAGMLIIDIANINRQLIDMNEKLLSFREALLFTRSVEVLQSFSKFSQPAGPKLVPWLVIGLAVFLPLGWVVAFTHSVVQKLKRRPAPIPVHRSATAQT